MIVQFVVIYLSSRGCPTDNEQKFCWHPPPLVHLPAVLQLSNYTTTSPSCRGFMAGMMQFSDVMLMRFSFFGGDEVLRIRTLSPCIPSTVVT